MDETKTIGYEGKFEWAYLDEMWKYKCNKNFKNYCVSFNDQTYPYKVPLPQRTSGWENSEDGVHTHKRIDIRYIYKSSW